MKISITGHTAGLGKALYNEFIKNNHEVLGFSRSNGFDISIKEDRKKIIEKTLNCDVFINNAYAPNFQKEMLSSIINCWKDQSKTIIHIGSKAIYSSNPPDFLKEYIIDKTCQNDLILQRLVYGRPYIMNVIPSVMDTDMAKNFNCKKMNTKDVAEIIYNLFSFKDKIAVQSIVLESFSLDWDNIRRQD